MGNLSSFSENCRVSSLMCVYIHKFSKNMVNFSPPPARHEYSQGYSNIYSNNYISGDGIRVSNGPRPDARRRKKERKREAREILLCVHSVWSRRAISRSVGKCCVLYNVHFGGIETCGQNGIIFIIQGRFPADAFGISVVTLGRHMKIS